MTNLRRALYLAIASTLLAGIASAQLAQKKALTLDAAKQIAAAAEKEAANNKWTMVIAILDDGGNLVYLERMDGTQIGSIKVAQQKAGSAVAFKRPTKVFADAVADGGTAILSLPGAMPVEGGLPLVVDGAVIGSIGASSKKSVLDAVQDEVADLQKDLGISDKRRLDEHLTSVRDLEKAIAGLPPDYGRNLREPEDVSDLTDYPRIARIQSDLVVHALPSGQTRVVSYMLTKCQGLCRFPWLGHTSMRHHEYTHLPGTPEGQRIPRDICKWHVEEFAYLLGRLQSVAEGDGSLLDRTCSLFIHEHAGANQHKDSGLAALIAGHAGGLKTGMHTRMRGTIGDLYLTLADEVFHTPLEKGFPTGDRKLSDLV
jgi:uncharacterized protein GlcG (DUF336 family)